MTSSLVYPKAPSNASEPLIQLYADAANGNLRSQLELGVEATTKGAFVPFEHSMFWLQRAAEQGSAMAMSTISYVYLTPGDHYDFAAGRFWNKMAADHGDEESELIDKILDVLGECYMTDALDCIEELYQCDSEGIFDPLILGDSFFCGSYVVEQDLPTAFRFYSVAESNGSAEACRKMGHMYEHGLGVEQSLEDAAGYYAMASLEDEEAGWLLRSLMYREEVRIPGWALE